MSAAVYPSLKDKLVVVTGGGSGIGAGFTEGFARQGARVVFLDVAVEDSQALAASLSGLTPGGVALGGRVYVTGGSGTSQRKVARSVP